MRLRDIPQALSLQKEHQDLTRRLEEVLSSLPFTDPAQRVSAVRRVEVVPSPGAFRISASVTLLPWGTTTSYEAPEWEYGLLITLQEHLQRWGYNPVPVMNEWRTIALDVRPRHL